MMGRGAWLAMLLSGAMAWAAQAAPPAGAKPAKLESQFFDSNGVKIHFVDVGPRDGEPVLLIHGFTANIQLQWGQPGVLDGLAEQYRVIALDNRGHGRSGKPHDPSQYGLEMVEDQIRLLDHLHIDQAHIVGYSMGGFITNKLLSVHPQRVLTATLGGAGWNQENDPQLNFMDELATSLEQGQGISPLIKRLTPPGRPLPTDEQLATMNQFVLLMNDAQALAAVIRSWKGLMVSEEDLRANATPVLALIGSDDPLKQGVDLLATVMPHLRVKVLDAADHLTAPAHPEFLGGLSGFLAEHARETAAAGAE